MCVNNLQQRKRLQYHSLHFLPEILINWLPCISQLSSNHIHAKSMWTRVRSIINLFQYYISQQHSSVPYNHAWQNFCMSFGLNHFSGEFATMHSAYYIQSFQYIWYCRILWKIITSFQFSFIPKEFNDCCIWGPTCAWRPRLLNLGMLSIQDWGSCSGGYEELYPCFKL